MKVVNVINTSGLIYDDRLVKESRTLVNIGVDIEILAFERDNKKKKGILFDKVKYKTLRLFTRSIFPKPRKALLLKAFEFNFKILLALLSKPGSVIWIHNIEMWGGVIIAIWLRKLGFLKGVIWDQHELPPLSILKRRFLKKIYIYTYKECDFVISANSSRLDYLIRNFGLRIGDNHLIINNYPAEKVVLSASRKMPQNIIEWLESKDYILFQGHATYERKIIECAYALNLLSEFKLIIVGPISDEILNELKGIFKENFSQRIFVIGMVPQEDLYIFIDNCFLSLVFYGNTSPNNWLCEPNRFYQAICRRKPVVCGANPSMKEIVEKYQCGFVTEDDGSNYQFIIEGVKFVAANYFLLKQNLEKNSKMLLWESNTESFHKIVARFADS